MPENPTYFSLSQAAEETGKSKSVISKALKSGRLSHNGKGENGYKIDPAELFRVFPKNTKNDTKNRDKERSRTHENDMENAFKIRELELTLAAEVKEKNFYKEQYGKMEVEKDKWADQAQRLLLAAPEKPVQAANENLGHGVGETHEKAIRGQNFTVFGSFIILLLLAGYVGMAFWPEIQDQINGIGRLNTINPAAGE